MAEFSGNGNAIHTVRFGAFEADLHAGEVRKEGTRIKLQDQPFKVLQLLLERPGVVVTRDELQARIWPEENFGDFDHAVNVAVGKLRTALGDCAEDPSFIETVPRRGYRFVAKLDAPPAAPPVEEAIPAVEPVPVLAAVPPPARAGQKRALFAIAATMLAASLVGAGVLVGHRMVQPASPKFARLTVRHGTVYSARFAPDGHTVIYGASWDGAPIQIFSADVQSAGTRSMEMPSTQLLGVSTAGEMAVLQPAQSSFMLTLRGTLGRVPITGGTPRQIAERVEWADWSPDGKSLAIVRAIGGKRRLEYPIGHLLYETTGWVGHPRISPKGDQIAFLDHPTDQDDQGVVSVIDMSGHKRVLSTGWETEQGLAWSPNGKEIWFSATQAGLERRIYAVDLAGQQRLAYQALGGVTLQDIAPDGRVLLTRDENRAGMIGMAPDGTKEKDLSWLDWSLPTDLSNDGKTLLFDEEGTQGGPNYTVATRDMSGSAPVPLGEGMAGSLSPDGKWAATTLGYRQIQLLPTGAGTARRLDRGGMEQYGHQVRWLPDGKHVVFAANLPGHATRCFVQDIDGGNARPVTPEGVDGCSVSPDGQSIMAKSWEGSEAVRAYPLDGGAPHPIPGLLPGDSVIRNADAQSVYVFQPRQQPMRIYRLNVVTGQRQLFRELHPNDPIGLCDMSHVLVSADGKAYVYSYTRMLSDLYMVKGLL